MRKLLHSLLFVIICISFAQNVNAQLYNSSFTAAQNKVLLWQYLNDVYGKKIISGQMDDSYRQYILDNTGKEPAMMGYDFDGICPSQTNKNNVDAEKAIRWVKERGGIAQFSWHWISPDANGDYYTTNFNLANALANPNGDSYKNIIRDIDLAAAELLKLKNQGVAVIWRPLHEAEGKWFWWGMSGGQACISLYRIMYDRFTNHHKLDNLIWTWTSYGTSRENWYPGDDVVDMIVWDYPDYNIQTGSWVQFNQLFGGKNKLFGIGEEGTLFNPDLFASQPWLYFLTWAYMVNEPTTTNGKNTKEWLLQVHNDPRVITLEDLMPGNKACAGYSSTVYDNNGDGKELITLSASLSKATDNDQITNYSWYKGADLVATGIEPTIELNIGTHIIKLVVTTQKGDTRSAYVVKKVRVSNLALNKTVRVSSTESGFGNIAANAVDGNNATRWSSAWAEPNWYEIDLGQKANVNEVIIHWQNASAKDYSIQISDDQTQWTTLRTLTDMKSGARIDTLKNLSGSARYIRMHGTRRSNQFGFSFFEFEVYGSYVSQSVRKTVFEDLKISPNILNVNTNINVCLPKNMIELKYKIFNSTGQLMQFGFVKSHESVISFKSKFNTGIYYIQFYQNNEVDTRQFIISE